MLITGKDVGRKVKDRYGSILTIINFFSSLEYPVCLSSGEKVSTTGHYWACKTASPLDIVSFVDEEEEDVHDLKDNKELQDFFKDDEPTTEEIIGKILKNKNLKEFTYITDTIEIRITCQKRN